MSKLSVNPLVLGVGAFVVAASGSSVLAGGADCDEALSASSADDSILTIAGAHGDGEEGECGEKDGEEGECGEGQCGEGEGEEDEGEEEEEA